MKTQKKKMNMTEEIKAEENGVELTDEELSSVSAGMWITKEEYEESGAEIVHRKCF